jgi:Zn-dependent peptidase ImmA (M78 family)
MAQLNVDAGEVSSSTGLSHDRLQLMATEDLDPTGDEVLIIADYFKCDFQIFISDDAESPIDRTEELYRKHGDLLTKNDRRSIQDFLFLCECQCFLMDELDKGKSFHSFTLNKKNEYHKGHGIDAAAKVRKLLGYSANQGPKDIFSDFRQLGIHIFRRTLENSSVSGVFIKHPIAGKCVLVNYSEDFFRQRFTVAHEVGHALLDDDKDINLSKFDSDKRDLSELRANTFASYYLIPPEFITSNLGYSIWDEATFLKVANALQVNSEPMAIALKSMKLIGDAEADSFRLLKIKSSVKHDPELPDSLVGLARARKEEILKKGLSEYYVKLCVEGYSRDLISWGRLAEMLLSNVEELQNIVELFGVTLSYDN